MGITCLLPLGPYTILSFFPSFFPMALFFPLATPSKSFKPKLGHVDMFFFIPLNFREPPYVLQLVWVFHPQTEHLCLMSGTLVLLEISFGCAVYPPHCNTATCYPGIWHNSQGSNHLCFSVVMAPACTETVKLFELESQISWLCFSPPWGLTSAIHGTGQGWEQWAAVGCGIGLRILLGLCTWPLS